MSTPPCHNPAMSGTNQRNRIKSNSSSNNNRSSPISNRWLLLQLQNTPSAPTNHITMTTKILVISPNPTNPRLLPFLTCHIKHNHPHFNPHPTMVIPPPNKYQLSSHLHHHLPPTSNHNSKLNNNSWKRNTNAKSVASFSDVIFPDIFVHIKK